MDLVAEIDRAVLELPEDLQVVWLRFRPLALEPFRFISSQPDMPRIYLFTWNQLESNRLAVDLYWPHNTLKAKSGTPLEVARRITEFFQEMTCT